MWHCRWTALVMLATQVLASADEKPLSDRKVEVEKAVRTLYTGIASTKKEEQIESLKRILPAKKDIETLFPKHAEKLWPLFEDDNKRRLEHVAEIAGEMSRKGLVKKIRLIDARKDLDPKLERNTSYRYLFQIIPQDISVFEAVIDFEKGSAGMDAYLFVNERAIFIRGFSGMAEAIKKSEKK